MKIAITADWHLSNFKVFEGSPDFISQNGVSKRLLEQRTTLLQLIDIAKREEVGLFLHGGDIVHSVGVVQNEVLNILKSIVDEITMPFIVTGGNHDAAIRKNPKPINFITNIVKAFSSEYIDLNKDVKIVNYYDKIDYDSIKDYRIVLLHKTPINAAVGQYKFEDGVNWKLLSKNNDFVFFGHIHQSQQLNKNSYVIGSPYHLTFGDAGERGFYIVDLDTNEVEFVKLNYPEFRTVKSPEQVEKNDGNYYRVLNSETRIKDENIVSIIRPRFFEERIKSDNFDSILSDWLKINGKDKTHLKIIEPILSEKLILQRDVFKGKLVEVEIKDFLSVKCAKYKVQRGFTLITGDGDNFTSNGAGKSTATGEAIFWCLFGETTKGLTGDDVIRREADDCSVESTLVLGADKVRLKRTRKKGLQVYVTRSVNQEGPENPDVVEGLRQLDKQSYLEKLLGFDKVVFLSSCYFSQENLLVLTGLSDVEKTNMIAGLLGFETYEDLYEKVSNKIADYYLEIEDKSKNKIGFEKDSAVLNSQIENQKLNLIEKYRQIESFNEFIADYEKKKLELQNQLEDVCGTFVKKDVTSELENLKLVEKEVIEDIGKIDGDLKDINSGVSSKVTEIAILTTKRTTLEENIEKIQKDIVELMNLESKLKCDKCGSLITKENVDVFATEKREFVTIRKKELEDLDSQLDTIRIELDAYKKAVSVKENQKELLRQQLTEIQNRSDLKLQEKEKYQKEVQEFKIQQSKLESRINEYDTFIMEHSKKLQDLKQQEQNIKNVSIRLFNELKLIQSYIEEIDGANKKISRDIERLEFWKIAFSSNGIRSVLLDRFCNEINVVVNKYLSFISNGVMSIVISPTKTIKSGETRNKIGMSILLDEVETKYIALSGGEKRRVDVSLIFGLNKWISTKFNVPDSLLGLMILDECFSFLDSTGEETVGNLLLEESKNKSIFVIDHALGLSAYADRIWTMKKSNNISSLEVCENYEAEKM